ncbi:hypothetical protein ONE63_000184 [Megalurothrips usitatus]|uniref:Uncharacterized protein n=1 Tax=Megalurothrips usitatus TaxID=439358 RepID=A0AAV7XXN8_9NEOP|nr:hypothetical protein ONE63_000184 [Megalurothrips usitatus]
MGSRTLGVLLAVLALLLQVAPYRYGPRAGQGGPGTLPSGRAAAAVQSLPPHLVMCYSDPLLQQRETRVPQTMANLVDLLQRVERAPGYVADLRLVVTTLLQRFRVDGLERNPQVPAGPGVTPYRLTGMQHARHSVLTGRLLSGDASLFPSASISLQQQCALHFMLSSAVDPWERGDEYWICPRTPTPRSNAAPRDQGDGEGYRPGPGFRMYPDPARDGTLMGGVFKPPPPAEPAPSVWSACPLEEGVVEAGRGGGDVSAGAVLAGLAAGLQPQEVPLASLLSTRHLEQLRADGGRVSDTVDNLWAATLAGDLAEVSAYQGPAAGGALALGPAGVWNDSLIPRVRYMSRVRPGSPELAPVQHWDMTDAEIRGGFDGLALGSRVGRWAERTGRLRLSQLLDMYYSPRGVAFEPDVRACSRVAAARLTFTPETLQMQTARFARTLSDASPDAPYMKEEALNNFTAASVRAFLRYAGDLLSAEACDSPALMSVRVNALVVLDTTWDRAPAFQFITRLTGPEGIDVGLFGSRIAVMNGGTGGPVGGHWIVNFTDSPVQLATDWVAVDAADDIWPTYLDLPWTLMAVFEHLRSKAEAESEQGSVGSTHGDVVVILATGSTVSDADMRHAKILVYKIKEINPDTRLLYVVGPLGQSRFQELASVRADWGDAVVVVDDIAPDFVAHSVANYLRESKLCRDKGTAPRRGPGSRRGPCRRARTSGRRRGSAGGGAVGEAAPRGPCAPAAPALASSRTMCPPTSFDSTASIPTTYGQGLPSPSSSSARTTAT